MKSVLFLAVALVARAAAQDSPTTNLTIATPVPGPQVCQPLLIKWGGGIPPYFLVSLPRHFLLHGFELQFSIDDSPPTGEPVVDFDQLTNTSLTWNVNVPVGTQLTLNIKDSTGSANSSAPFIVTTSGSESCVNGGGSSGAPPASSDGATAAPTSPSTPASSGPPSSATSPKPVQPGTSSGDLPTISDDSDTGSAVMASGVPTGVLPACAAVFVAALLALLA
ncbi:hypothetical protein GGX14DRAFT_628803, partial [Mycena pura]